MFVEALKKVNTIQEWQSLTLWLMSFCLRGFYYGDFVRMSDNSLVTLKLRQNDQYDKIKAPRNLFGDFYLDTLRQKSNVNILVKMERPVMRLIGMFKMSLAYTKINKKFDGKRILAHINDRIGLVDYDINKVQPHHLMPGLITEDCEWAYPKEESFRRGIQFARNNKNEIIKDSHRLATYLREKFSIKNIHNQYKEFNKLQVQSCIEQHKKFESEIDSLLDDLI